MNIEKLVVIFRRLFEWDSWVRSAVKLLANFFYDLRCLVVHSTLLPLLTNCAVTYVNFRMRRYLIYAAPERELRSHFWANPTRPCGKDWA